MENTDGSRRRLDRTFETTAGGAALTWLSDTTLVAAAEDRGQTHLYSVTLDGSAPTPLTSGPIAVNSFDFGGRHHSVRRIGRRRCQ